MEESTTLKVTKKQRDFIAKAAQRYDKPIGQFAYQCTVFVHKNKYDPFGQTDILVAEEVRKLKEQLVSFIRTQEKNYIVPLQATQRGMVEQMIKFQSLLQEVYLAVADERELIEAPQAVKESPMPKEEGAGHSKRIEELEKALQQKDQYLQQMRHSLQSIKDSAIASKFQVKLAMGEDVFVKLVSII